MAINDFEKSVASFQEKIDAKRVLLEAKADEIKKDLSSEFNVYMKKAALAKASTTLEGRSRYLLDPVSKDFPSIFNAETDILDGDTIKVTSPYNAFYGDKTIKDTIRLGSQDPGTGLDTYEIAKYDENGKLLPYNRNKYDYHRIHYAKTHGLPSKEYVTQEMLHVEAQKQTSRLVEELYKGVTWDDYEMPTIHTSKDADIYPKEYQDRINVLTAEFYKEAGKLEEFKDINFWKEAGTFPIFDNDKRAASNEAYREKISTDKNLSQRAKDILLKQNTVENWIVGGVDALFEYMETRGERSHLANLQRIREQIGYVKFIANQKRGPIDPALLTGDVAVDVRKDGVGMYDRDLGVLYNPETGVNLNHRLNTLTNNASYWSKYNKAYAEKIRKNMRLASLESKGGDGWWIEADRGISIGIDNVQATGFAFAMLIADLLGKTEIADKFLSGYLQQIDSAQRRGIHLPKVEEVDWSDKNEALSKVGRLFGEGIPSIVTMMGGAKIGSWIANKIAQRKVKKIADSKVKAAVLQKLTNRGAYTGALTPAFVMETGSIYGEVGSLGERDLRAILMSLSGGAIAASLEAIFPASFFATRGASKTVTNKIKERFIKRGLIAAKKIAQATASGASVEAMTEGLQFVVEEITQELIVHGDLSHIDAQEFISGIVNSMAAGAAPGGGLRLGTSFVSEGTKLILDTDKKRSIAVVNETNRDAQEALNRAIDEESSTTTAQQSESTLRKVLNDVLLGKLSLDQTKYIFDFASKTTIEIDPTQSNLAIATQLVNELNTLKNQSSDETLISRIDESLNALNSALQEYQSSSAEAQMRKDLVLNQNILEREKLAIEEDIARKKAEKTKTGKDKTPKAIATLEEERIKRIAKAESKSNKRANKLKSVKAYKAGRRAAAAVINNKVDETIKAINRIQKELTDPNLTKSKRKRLERELQSNARILQALKNRQTSPYELITKTRANKIESTLNRVKNFEDRIVDRISNEELDALYLEIEIVRAELDKVNMSHPEDLKDIANREKEILRLVEVLDGHLTKLKTIKTDLMLAIDETTNKKELKALNVLVKGIDSHILALQKQLLLVDETYETTEEETEESSKKNLNSLNLNTINTELELSEEEKSNLTAPQKVLHRLRGKILGSVNKIKKILTADKTLAIVHDEIIKGTKENKGLNQYLQDAKDEIAGKKNAKFDRGAYKYFVTGLYAKAKALNKAFKSIGKSKKTLYISKQRNEDGSYSILTKVPKDAKTYKTKQGRTRYTDYWFVNNKSGNFVNMVTLEAEYANQIGGYIRKVLSNQKIEGTTEELKAEVQKKLKKVTKEAEATGETTGNLEDVKSKGKKPKTKKKKVTKKEEIKALKDKIANLKKVWIAAKNKSDDWMNDKSRTDDETNEYLTKNVTPHQLAWQEARIELAKVEQSQEKTQKGIDRKQREIDNLNIELNYIKRAALGEEEAEAKPEEEKTPAKRKLSEQEQKAEDRINKIKEAIVADVKRHKELSKSVDLATIAEVAELESRIAENRKLLRELKKIKKGKEKSKFLNHFITKFRNSFLSLALVDPVLKVKDLFNIKDIKRDSFFSRNTDTILTKANIEAKLNELGITDKAYIEIVSKHFVMFKTQFENKIQNELSDDNLSKGIYVLMNPDSQLALATTDESNKAILPDEVLFAMMLATMHWNAINKNASRTMPRYVMAQLLYGDPKLTHLLTTKQIKTFQDIGSPVKNAAQDIGKEVFDLLNIKPSRETEATIAELLKLQEKNPAFKNILIKDPLIANRASIAIGLLAIQTARHMYLPTNLEQKKIGNTTYKLIQGGLLDLHQGRYDEKLFQNPLTNEFYTEDGNISLNSIVITDSKAINDVLEVFYDNPSNLKLIKGAETTLRDTYNEPVAEVQEKTDNGFFKLNRKVKKVIKKLQNVAWVGKVPELELVALFVHEDKDGNLVIDETLKRLIGIKDINTAHDTDRESVEASNKEKIADIEYIWKYLNDRDEKGNLKTFYFRYKALTQHRLRIDSNTINPQRSKMMRALFFPSNEATVKTESDKAIFKLAVVQAFGYDITTLDQALKDFETIQKNEVIKDELLPLLSDVKKNKDNINQLINQIIDEGVVKGESMHVIEGLIALSNYKEKGNFKTTIGFETDGITNGYAIGLLQFITGTPREMQTQLARVGIHVDIKGVKSTHEQFIASRKLDAYQTFSDTIYKKLKKKATKVEMQVIEKLHGEYLDVDDKISDFARDLAKNPFMISNYGAGVARVITNIIEEIVPNFYKKLADFQTRYDQGTEEEQKAIKKEVLELQKFINKNLGINVKLAARLAKKGTKKDKFDKDIHHNLYGFTFSFVQQKKIERYFREIYTDTITETLDEILKPIKEASDLIVQAVEIQYFAFINRFETLTEGVTNMSTQMAIAAHIANDIMPSAKGPWSETDADLVQLIKVKPDKNKAVQILINKGVAAATELKSYEKWTPLEYNNNKYLQAVSFIPKFAAAGVSAMVNMVQNMDSVVLGETLDKNPRVLPLYDAVISSVTDVLTNVANYNKYFLHWGLKHSLLESTQERLLEVVKQLTKEEVTAVQRLIQTDSHQIVTLNKTLARIKKRKTNRKYTPTVKRKELAKVQKAIKDFKKVNIGTIQENLYNKIEDIKEAHAQIDLENATVSQMYVPESILDPSLAPKIDSTPAEAEVAKPKKKVSKQQEKEEEPISLYKQGIEKLITIRKNLKAKKKTTKVFLENNIKSLARVHRIEDGKIIRYEIKFNIKAIVKDYNNDMAYIDGKGTGIHARTSKQKGEVFKNINREEFKKFIKDNGGVAKYIEFIYLHEIGHIVNKDHDRAIPKTPDGKIDYMHPNEIAVEIGANEYAFKAIGYKPTRIATETQEVEVATEKDVETIIEKTKIKALKFYDTNIETIYYNSPALQKIGSLIDYNRYVNSVLKGIIPNQHGVTHEDSVIQEIVFHGTPETIIFDKFDDSKAGVNTFTQDFDSQYGFFFTDMMGSTLQYGVLSIQDSIKRREWLSGAYHSYPWTTPKQKKDFGYFNKTQEGWSYEELMEREPEFHNYMINKLKAIKTKKERARFITHVQRKLKERGELLGQYGSLNLFNNYIGQIIKINHILKGTLPNKGTYGIWMGDFIEGNYPILVIRDGIIDWTRGDFNPELLPELEQGKPINEVSMKDLTKIFTPRKTEALKTINNQREVLNKENMNPLILNIALNIKSPLIHDLEKKGYKEGALEIQTKKSKEAALDNRYDGAIFKNVKDPYLMTSYLALETEQIHIFGSAPDVENFKKYAVPEQQELSFEKKLNSIDEQVDAELNETYTTRSVRENLQKIFEMLGKLLPTEAFSTKESRRAHKAHLQRILDDIISKAGIALDNTKVILKEGDVKTHGHAFIENSNVVINYNKYEPESYSEQSPQEVYAHELIHIITEFGLRQDEKFRTEIERIRKQVLKEIIRREKRPYEIFLNRDKNGNIIYLTDKASEIAAAKAQYERTFFPRDDNGNRDPTAELDEFLAYGLTNKFLVPYLSEMQSESIPFWSKEPGDTVVEKLVKLLVRIIDSIASVLGAKKRPANVEEEIFMLTKKIVDINQAKQKKIKDALYVDHLGNAIDQGNAIISNFVKERGKQGIVLTGKSYAKLVDVLTKDGKLNGFLSNVLYDSKLITLLALKADDFYDKHPEVQKHFDRAYRNFKPSFLKVTASYKADIFGGVNQDFIRLLYKSHKEVDANRRQYKEFTKEALARVFTDYEALDDTDKVILTKMLLKTDVATLISGKAFTMDEVVDLLNDPALLKKALDKYRKGLNKYYMRQSFELAKIMVTGKTQNTNQYLNAHAIYFSKPFTGSRKIKAESVINNIDIYTTLLALERTINSTEGALTTFNKIAKREFKNPKRNGITGMVNLHIAFKKKSLEEGFYNKRTKLVSPQLMRKGYIATITDPTRDVIAEKNDAKTIAQMMRWGYTYVGKFHDIDGLLDKGYGLYVLKNNPDTARTKGVISMTSKRFAGVSIKEIIARDGGDAKDIMTKFTKFKNKQAKLANTLSKNYTMVPVVNEDMEIVDYRVNLEHHMMEKHLNQDLRFDEVLPTMYSHLEDKLRSEEINKEAIDLLYQYGKLNYKKKPKKFINILDDKYKEEYFRPLPKQAKYEINFRATTNSQTGKKEFWVERGYLDTVFGYQNPSLSNVKLLKNSPKYQRYVRVFETLFKEMVSLAVVNIVIKIPIVPAVNFLSNFVTSVLYGVPPVYLIRKWREGISELRKYTLMAKELKLLDITIMSDPALENDPDIKYKRDKLIYEMNNNKVSKFIDAGLFNSITEDINQNSFTYRNKIFSKISAKGKGLVTGKIVDVANHAYIGERTALFKASMHFLQMSDFIARYALHSYNTQVKGMSEAKAWKMTVETFVNYDQPLNRHLGYFNDMGLIFFVKYWLRIQRAGFNLMIERPLNVALFFTGEVFLGVDIETILDSNIIAGNYLPVIGGFDKVFEEVIIPPGIEILMGEGVPGI